ncbi:MAG: hypothetical protein ACE5JF_06875 [Anaerolineales bacterium]
MTRYLIEVPHEDNKDACNQAVQAFMETGSHFMTNADWGCGDGEHKAWFIVDLDSRDQAKQLLPPLFRENAKVIELQKFSPADSERTIQEHGE